MKCFAFATRSSLCPMSDPPIRNRRPRRSLAHRRHLLHGHAPAGHGRIAGMEPMRLREPSRMSSTPAPRTRTAPERGEDGRVAPRQARQDPQQRLVRTRGTPRRPAAEHRAEDGGVADDRQRESGSSASARESSPVIPGIISTAPAPAASELRGSPPGARGVQARGVHARAPGFGVGSFTAAQHARTRSS